MLKRLLLFFRLARQGSTVESLNSNLGIAQQEILRLWREVSRLESVLENIAALHPIGGQRRLLAKAALPKELRPPV